MTGFNRFKNLALVLMI